MIRFACECGRQLQAREDDIGRKARCPTCDRVMVVPTEADARSRQARPRPEAVSCQPALVAAAERHERSRKERTGPRRDEPEPQPTEPEETSGKAAGALALGIFSVILPVLAAVFSVVLGVLALRDIRDSKGRLGGRGLAWAGIVLSCLIFIGQAGALVLIPSLAHRDNEDSARTEDAANLHELGVALNSFMDAHGRLPQASAFPTRENRPGLSWRVALLPFLDQEALYRQFNLDEPWDSPHNKGLLPLMPRVYQLPGQRTPTPGMTHYQVFVGPQTLFEPQAVGQPGKGGPPVVGAPSRLLLGVRVPGDVPDRLSSTILVATARNPVPWTRPEDLHFTASGLLPPLGGHFRDGFHVLLGDGSVNLWPQAVPVETVRAATTRNGGEIVELP